MTYFPQTQQAKTWPHGFESNIFTTVNRLEAYVKMHQHCHGNRVINSILIFITTNVSFIKLNRLLIN